MGSIATKIKKIIYHSIDKDYKYWDYFNKYNNSKNEIVRSFYHVKMLKIEAKKNSRIAHSKNIKPFEMPHGLSGIFISMAATIDDGCTILQQVTIGSNTSVGSKRNGAPKIGKNVFIGAGAKIIGGVTIGDNARIGAGCVVTEDVPANATVVMGKPRIILHESPRDNKYVDINKLL